MKRSLFLQTLSLFVLAAFFPFQVVLKTHPQALRQKPVGKLVLQMLP
jgi:hypothetical protein